MYLEKIYNEIFFRKYGCAAFAPYIDNADMAKCRVGCTLCKVAKQDDTFADYYKLIKAPKFNSAPRKQQPLTGYFKNVYAQFATKKPKLQVLADYFKNMFAPGAVWPKQPKLQQVLSDYIKTVFGPRTAKKTKTSSDKAPVYAKKYLQSADFFFKRSSAKKKQAQKVAQAIESLADFFDLFYKNKPSNPIKNQK